MNRLGSMWTNPRMADHRAPMTYGKAFINGVVAGIILGVTLGLGGACTIWILFML